MLRAALHREQERKAELLAVRGVERLQPLELVGASGGRGRRPPARRSTRRSCARARRGRDARAAAPAARRRAAARPRRHHRRVQRVERRERPRVPGALGHPRRVLEHPAERVDERPGGRWRSARRASQCVSASRIGSARYTASPATRTSRTLSAPASVKIAASDSLEAAGALTARRPAALSGGRAQVDEVGGLARRESRRSRRRAQRLGAGQRRQIEQLRRSRASRRPAATRCIRYACSLPSACRIRCRRRRRCRARTCTPASRWRRSGKMPLPSAALLHGQCAIDVPRRGQPLELGVGRVDVVRQHRARVRSARSARRRRGSRPPMETARGTSAISRGSR